MSDVRMERNYGIDLFRLFSMFMVVGLHVLGKGGILSSVETLTFKGEAVWFFEIAMFGAVNCFAIISGFLGYRSRHKSVNLVNMCFGAVFYCLVFTGAYLVYTYLNSGSISLAFLIECLVPTLFGGYWYISAYFCLFFFMPLLNKIVDLPKETLKKLAIIIILLGMVVVKGREVSGLASGYSFLWLAILYVLGAYIAKYSPFSKWTLKVNLIGYFACIVFTLISKISIEIATKAVFGKVYLSEFFVSYTSPSIILSSIFLFNIFVKINPCSIIKKTAVLLSPCALGVYFIHCHPFVFDTLLGGRFAYLGSEPVFVLIPLAFAIAIAIFFACLIVEMIRLKAFKILKINVLAVKIAQLVEYIINKIVKSEREEA